MLCRIRTALMTARSAEAARRSCASTPLADEIGISRANRPLLVLDHADPPSDQSKTKHPPSLMSSAGP